MADEDWRRAAALAMPDDAKLSHVSRLQAAGLDVGAVQPVHFTVARDLHLDLDGVTLHRTEVMPPTDDVGVRLSAAYIQYCATATVLEAVAAGDWLLHRDLVTREEMVAVARAQRWRPGARQVLRVVTLLHEKSRSLPESRLRILVWAAGLPMPEVNVPIVVDGRVIAIVDLLIREVMLALEYEGRQHAESTQQFRRDIVRYADLRRVDVEYLQVTHEMFAQAKALVLDIFQRMRELGYTGPPPVFGDRWRAVFRAIRLGGGLATDQRS